MGLEVHPPPFKLSEYTDQDSDGNVMLKDHAYQAVSAGFVSSHTNLTTGGNALQGFVGNTTNPAIDGKQVAAQSIGNTAHVVYIAFLVGKGEYFEVLSEAAAPEIYWKSFGTLRKPIDFN